MTASAAKIRGQARERARRRRVRERAGRIVVLVEVDEIRATEAFADAGLLPRRRMDDRAALAEAIERAINILVDDAEQRHA